MRDYLRRYLQQYPASQILTNAGTCSAYLMILQMIFTPINSMPVESAVVVSAAIYSNFRNSRFFEGTSGLGYAIGFFTYIAANILCSYFELTLKTTGVFTPAVGSCVLLYGASMIARGIEAEREGNMDQAHAQPQGLHLD